VVVNKTRGGGGRIGRRKRRRRKENKGERSFERSYREGANLIAARAAEHGVRPGSFFPRGRGVTSAHRTSQRVQVWRQEILETKDIGHKRYWRQEREKRKRDGAKISALKRKRR